MGLLEAEVDDPATVDEVLTQRVSEGRGSKRRRMVPLPVFDTEDITSAPVKIVP